jgi:hypothetical protein
MITRSNGADIASAMVPRIAHLITACRSVGRSACVAARIVGACIIGSL